MHRRWRSIGQHAGAVENRSTVISEPDRIIIRYNPRATWTNRSGEEVQSKGGEGGVEEVRGGGH